MKPNWWKIGTLDESDIVDAWDFGWKGHADAASMPVGFVNGETFTNRAGNPSYRLGDGIYVGGAGAIHVPTTGLDWNEASVIIEVAGCSQQGTLDAIFSHYLPDAYFVVQNDFPDGELRWTCGHPDSASTIEIANALTPDGVIGVSGPNLYREGEKVGEVPDTTSAPLDTNFIIGCITTDGSNETQFMKGTIKRVLIVKRRLTEAEQAKITLNMKNCEKPAGELLDNFDFNCGTIGWTHDANYPATITDNGDGSVHLKADSDYGSLVPMNDVLPSADYVIEVSVRNVSGNGKISIRNTANQWHNLEYYDADGVYSATYTGDIKDIHVGAADDTNFEADYDYISLKKT